MNASQRLREWMAAGGKRHLAGYDVFVRSAVTPGRPPLLLIHGYPTASYDWVRVWPRLAEHHSLYALDLLGFGLSDRPGETGYPISLQADICMALLEDSGVTETHVLAHDYGDTVAQELLAREREGRLQIASMVFLNGGLFPETHRPRLVQRLLARPLIGPLMARAMNYGKFESTMLSISGREPPTREELADLWTLIEQGEGRVTLARLISYMEQRRRNRPRWVGALVESTVPRRYICGAVDPISGRHLAERYRELVPGADVVLLEDVGHYPQLEVHERVVDEYEAFRRRVDGLSRTRTP